MHREPEVPEAKTHWKNVSISLQGLPQRKLHHFNLWKMASSRMLFLQVRGRIGEKCTSCVARLKNTSAKGLKKECWQKCSAFFWGRKIIQQLGLRILKIWSRRSLHRFWGRAQAVVRHADIWDQTPSHGMICPGDSHQRNPNSPKFEGRSQEVTECQWRCARWAAWRLAKKILKLKVKQSTAFFTLSENWCLLAPSSFET